MRAPPPASVLCQASEAPKAPATNAALPGAEAWATAGRPSISPANVAAVAGLTAVSARKRATRRWSAGGTARSAGARRSASSP